MNKSLMLWILGIVVSSIGLARMSLFDDSVSGIISIGLLFPIIYYALKEERRDKNGIPDKKNQGQVEA